MTVLVVEDNEVAALLAAGLLTDWGFDFLRAHSVEQALNVLHGENRIDLVITDLVMPDSDGVDFIKRMRELPQVTTVPTIIVTAFPDYRKEEVKELGIPVLGKPFTSQQLLSTIKKVTGLELANHEK